jgi:hypothetical protein
LIVSAAILFVGGIFVKDSVLAIISAAKVAQAQHQAFSLVAVMPTRQTLIIMAVCLFLVMWIGRIAKSIITRACWNVATTGSARLSNAFGVGFRYFYVYFMQMLAVAVAIALMYVVQYLFSMIGLLWLNVVIAILSQLVLYYVVVKLVLVDSAAVIDECGMRGFARSWCAISHNWWRTVAALSLSLVFYAVFLYLVFMGISSLVFAPGVNPFFSSYVFAMQGVSPTWFPMVMCGFGGLTALSIVFTVPTMVGSSQAVLYNDLKNRRQRNYH